MWQGFKRLFGSLVNKAGLGGKGDGGIVKGYISCRKTVQAARKMGLSVCDYLEMLWGKQGDTQRVIDLMKEFGVFAGEIRRVCEIGTGSGRYLEKVLQLCGPNLESYESYEPADDWAKWLAEQYGITSHKADGQSLRYTPTSSVDLVHAHGVFVYLSFMVTLRYFREIVRVIRRGVGCL